MKLLRPISLLAGLLMTMAGAAAQALADADRRAAASESAAGREKRGAQAKGADGCEKARAADATAQAGR